MKTKARQDELAMEDGGFRLVGEDAVDGDRVTAEAERRERERQAAEKRQLPLFGK